MNNTLGDSMEMPRYQSHKKVWALKIDEIACDDSGRTFFKPKENEYGKVFLSPEFVEKHKPYAGGYYVVYGGGYKSFSPAEAFESGYTRIDSQ